MERLFKGSTQSKNYNLLQIQTQQSTKQCKVQQCKQDVAIQHFWLKNIQDKVWNYRSMCISKKSSLLIIVNSKNFYQKELIKDPFSTPKYATTCFRSSHRMCSVKKVFLTFLQNLQENTCARVYFLITLQAPPATLLKKRLWYRCFPVNFWKILRAPSFKEHFRWLLLLFVSFSKNFAYLLNGWYPTLSSHLTKRYIKLQGTHNLMMNIN